MKNTLWDYLQQHYLLTIFQFQSCINKLRSRPNCVINYKLHLDLDLSFYVQLWKTKEKFDYWALPVMNPYPMWKCPLYVRLLLCPSHFTPPKYGHRKGEEGRIEEKTREISCIPSLSACISTFSLCFTDMITAFHHSILHI